MHNAFGRLFRLETPNAGKRFFSRPFRVSSLQHVILEYYLLVMVIQSLITTNIVLVDLRTNV